MKRSRHEKIIEIVSKYDIETQEELRNKLKESGCDVTQATVSRDIRELKLIKTAQEGKHYKYSAGEESKRNQKESNGAKNTESILAQSIIKTDSAENLVVIKTYPGMAQGSAAALDEMGISGIIGSIAGDDTILMVAKNEEIAKRLCSVIGFIKKKASGG